MFGEEKWSIAHMDTAQATDNTDLLPWLLRRGFLSPPSTPSCFGPQTQTDMRRAPSVSAWSRSKDSQFEIWSGCFTCC